jgi:hypothetical protein
MKDRVDKSMGIVTHITEVLTRIKPTVSLRLDKCEARKKRNYSDSSGDSPAKILTSRYECKKSSRVTYPRISDDNAESSFWPPC